MLIKTKTKYLWKYHSPASEREEEHRALGTGRVPARAQREQDPSRGHPRLPGPSHKHTPCPAGRGTATRAGHGDRTVTVRILFQSNPEAEGIGQPPLGAQARKTPGAPRRKGELSDVQSARATERTDTCHQGWGRGRLPSHRCRPGPSVPRSNMASAVSSPGPERPRASSDPAALVTKSKLWWKSRKDTRRGLQTEAASQRQAPPEPAHSSSAPSLPGEQSAPRGSGTAAEPLSRKWGHEGGPGSRLPQGRGPARHWRPQAISGPLPLLPQPCRVPTAAEVLILREQQALLTWLQEPWHPPLDTGQSGGAGLTHRTTSTASPVSVNPAPDSQGGLTDT